MVLQLEDCIDILNHTHAQFQFIFLFDHSNGHDRLQPQGLSLSKISIRYGGKQPYMRKSKLSSSEFGPFHNPSYKLQPGMEQEMHFSPSDEGPCYFSNEERMKRRLDIHSGKLKDCLSTRKELIEGLHRAGMINPSGSKKELQEQSTRLGLPIKKQHKVISEGWVGCQKGSLQILFERGWINPEFLQHYTSDGKKQTDSNQTNCNANKNLESSSSSHIPVDPTGCNYSLKAIMKLQYDFANEITLLQFHGNELGVIIDRTPKCHPEIAGEGIEYAWALSKFFYRRSPICQKRTKAKFRQLVSESTNHNTVLNIQRMRSCSKKARCYMKMYRAFDNVELDEKLVNEKHSIMEGTIKQYTRLKRKGKTHRSVCDRNVADVNEIADSIPLNIHSKGNSDANSGDTGRVKSELIGLLLEKMTRM